MPNYTLGRGKVYFDRFVAGTKTKTGERYFGNTPEFNINLGSESLDHFNSDEGVRTKDDSVILELTRQGTFITDDISKENLALFLLGDASILTQASGTGLTSTHNNIYKDRYYQLGATSGNPSGDRNVSNVVVTKLPATALVLGTDYTVDAALGRIYILPTTATAITEGTDDITVTYDRAAITRERVVTAANSVIEGAMRFVSFNPKGNQRDWYMPYVKLAPNGDFALKGDAFQQVPFNVDILLLDETTQAIYVDGRAIV